MLKSIKSIKQEQNKVLFYTLYALLIYLELIFKRKPVMYCIFN